MESGASLHLPWRAFAVSSDNGLSDEVHGCRRSN
jgi:hypothetical protein